MRIRLRDLAFLFFILNLTISTAQADWVEELKSPLTTDAKWIALTGTGLTVAVVLTRDSISGPWEEWTARNRPLGKSSEYGDALGQLIPNALYAGGMWVASFYDVPLAWKRTLIMVKATAYSGLITTILKYSISEGRPYNTEKGSSFPSGHTSTAFAFAGVVAAEHGWGYGVPAMLLATFVAYSRINDIQHRVHDVVAGATIGLTCAYGIHFVNQENSDSAFQVLPFPIADGHGLMARWSF